MFLFLLSRITVSKQKNKNVLFLASICQHLEFRIVSIEICINITKFSFLTLKIGPTDPEKSVMKNESKLGNTEKITFCLFFFFYIIFAWQPEAVEF